MGNEHKSFLSTKTLMLYDLAQVKKFLSALKSNKGASFLASAENSKPLAEMQILDFDNIYADKKNQKLITDVIIELIQINPHIRQILINNEKNNISKANLNKLHKALAKRPYIQVVGLANLSLDPSTSAIEITSSYKTVDVRKWRNRNSYELLEEEIEIAKPLTSIAKGEIVNGVLPVSPQSAETVLKDIKAACNIHVKFLADTIETTISQSPFSHLFNQFHGAALVNKLMMVLARPKPSRVSTILDNQHCNIALNRYEIMKKLLFVLNDVELAPQQKVMRFHHLLSNITLPRLLQTDSTHEMNFNDAVMRVHQFVQSKRTGAQPKLFFNSGVPDNQVTPSASKKTFKT